MHRQQSDLSLNDTAVAKKYPSGEGRVSSYSRKFAGAARVHATRTGLRVHFCCFRSVLQSGFAFPFLPAGMQGRSWLMLGQSCRADLRFLLCPRACRADFSCSLVDACRFVFCARGHAGPISVAVWLMLLAGQICCFCPRACRADFSST